MRQAIGLLSLSALLSCSNGLDPSNGLGPSNDLAGTWASNFTVPGSSIDLNLEQTDRNITGTGSFAIEAGRSGTLTVTGSYDRPRIALVLHYDFGLNLTYSGTVVFLGFGRQMSGILADSLGHEYPLTFTRR